MKLPRIQHIVPLASVILCFVGLLVFTFSIGVTSQAQNTIVNVADADSFDVKNAKGIVKRVRLYGIDCPEKQQAGGLAAMAFVTPLLNYPEVKVDVLYTDQYDRDVVIMTLADGRVLNEELVRFGQAWVYRRYCDVPQCSYWEELEAQARKDKKGLWASSRPEAPWKWRSKNPR